MGLVAPLQQYVEDLVHHSAQDVLERERHRVFIAQRLLGALLVFAAFPLYLAVRGAPSTYEVAAFGLVLLPLVLAYYLSATGQYDTAIVLSAIGLAAVVCGLFVSHIISASTAAFWLALVPVECALLGSRRSLLAACLCSLMGMALIFASSDTDMSTHLLPWMAPMAAAVYLLIIAWSARSLVASARAFAAAERARYHLVASNMTEAVVAHGPHGEINSASAGGVESLLATSCQSILGRGFFDRLQVADRPAYLTALANARDGHKQMLPLRVRTANGHYMHIEMESRSVQKIGDRAEVITVMRKASPLEHVSGDSAEIYDVRSRPDADRPERISNFRPQPSTSEMKISA